MTETQQAATQNKPGESGWVTFAAVVFIIAGVANIFWGIGALDDRGYFDEEGIIYGTLTTWGWVAIFFGIAQILAAIALFQGGEGGRWLGVAIAGVSALYWFWMFPVLPLFALAVIAIDILIIYGLTARWED